MDLWSQLLGGVAIVSGIGVIAFRQPLRSILCAGIQTIALAWLLFLTGSAWAAIGLVVLMALIYAAVIQLVRAVGSQVSTTRQRFGYGQVVGLLAAALFGLYLLLVMIDSSPELVTVSAPGAVTEVFGFDSSILFVSVLLVLTTLLGFRIIWGGGGGERSK